MRWDGEMDAAVATSLWTYERMQRIPNNESAVKKDPAIFLSLVFTKRRRGTLLLGCLFLPPLLPVPESRLRGDQRKAVHAASRARKGNQEKERMGRRSWDATTEGREEQAGQSTRNDASRSSGISSSGEENDPKSTSGKQNRYLPHASSVFPCTRNQCV